MGVNARRAEVERELAARRELFAVLAHEFRSPIGAIIGYEELLSEGIMGEVPEAGQDALARIRSSALQLLDLVAGLNDLSVGSEQNPVTAASNVELRPLLDRLMAGIATEAGGRGTSLELLTADDLPALVTDLERAQRGLQLSLMAAVKATAVGRITVQVHADAGYLEIRITAPGLDPRRDEPDLSLHGEADPRLTGAGLRIAMARQALVPLHGEIALEPADTGGSLRLRLPLRPAD